MTLLGKILVYVNLVLSVCMCALGVGIYTNRLDWVGKGSPPRVPAGEVEARRLSAERWKPLVESAGPALYDARTGQRGLLIAEAIRPANQDWYISQLYALEGKDARGNIFNGPVSELAYDARGHLVMGRDGHPALKPTALATRLGVQENLKKVRDRIAATLTAIAKLQQAYNTLTVEINGDKQANRKGLTDFIQEVRDAQAKSAATATSLQPLTINRRIEAYILKERQQELIARIKELESSKATGVASRRP